MSAHARRVDNNQAEIVKALRKAGCKVYVASSFGKGFPDLIVALPNRTWAMLEIKDGSKPPSAQELTPEQVKFHEEYKGWPLYVVRSVDEALAVARR